MSEVQDDVFNRDRAELFEALGHPTRIKILEAMKDGPMSFSELKKVAGIQSSGHLTFHLDKLRGLVVVASDGLYALTDDGREAIRLVGHRVVSDIPLKRLFRLLLPTFAVAAALATIAAIVLGIFVVGLRVSLGYPDSLYVSLVIILSLMISLDVTGRLVTRQREFG